MSAVKLSRRSLFSNSSAQQVSVHAGTAPQAALTQGSSRHFISGVPTRIWVNRRLDESGRVGRISAIATILPTDKLTDEDYRLIGIAKPQMARNAAHLRELIVNGLNRTSLVGVRLLVENGIDASVLSVKHDAHRENGKWVRVKEDPSARVNDFMKMVAPYLAGIGEKAQFEVIQVAKKFINLKKRAIGKREEINSDMIAVAERYEFGLSDRIVRAFAPTNIKLSWVDGGDTFVSGFMKAGESESSSLRDAILNAQTENLRPPVMISWDLMNLPQHDSVDSEEEVSFDGSEILSVFGVESDSVPGAPLEHEEKITPEPAVGDGESIATAMVGAADASAEGGEAKIESKTPAAESKPIDQVRLGRRRSRNIN